MHCTDLKCTDLIYRVSSEPSLLFTYAISTKNQMIRLIYFNSVFLYYQHLIHDHFYSISAYLQIVHYDDMVTLFGKRNIKFKCFLLFLQEMIACSECTSYIVIVLIPRHYRKYQMYTHHCSRYHQSSSF